MLYKYSTRWIEGDIDTATRYHQHANVCGACVYRHFRFRRTANLVFTRRTRTRRLRTYATNNYSSIGQSGYICGKHHNNAAFFIFAAPHVVRTTSHWYSTSALLEDYGVYSPPFSSWSGSSVQSESLLIPRVVCTRHSANVLREMNRSLRHRHCLRLTVRLFSSGWYLASPYTYR